MNELSFYEKNNKKIVIALGFFDAVHKGHVEVITAGVKLSKKLRVDSAVFTFSSNPAKFFKKESKLLCLINERKEKFSALGVDTVVCAPCSQEFFDIEPIDFLKKLKNDLNVVGIVCGYDYTFGKFGKGDINFIEGFCQENSIEFSVVDKVVLSGIKVSSRDIRAFIENGEIELANYHLGYNYTLSGKVIKGRGEGKKSLYPTINFEFPQEKVLPKSGVYATKTLIDGIWYACVTNVGTHPTFDDYSENIETYVIDFEGDLYGKIISVSFVQRLRDISKFNSVEELKAQISKDVSKAVELL